MPLITVWNSVDSDAYEPRLDHAALRERLCAACLEIAELGLTEERQVTVRFPDCVDKVSPGHPIVVIVELLFDKPERTLEVRQRLAVALRDAVQASFLCMDRTVEVAVKRFSPERDAYATGAGSYVGDVGRE